MYVQNALIKGTVFSIQQLSSQSNVMHVHENKKELITVQYIQPLRQITTLNFNTVRIYKGVTA